MADFAGTVAHVASAAPFGGHPGALAFSITLSATAYVSSGTVNLSGIKVPPGVNPDQLKSVTWDVGGVAAGYMVVWTPATTPTWANIGVLRLYTATGTEATGSLTLVVRGTALIFPAASVL